MKNVLIIGSMGYIGTRLMEFLGASYNVTGVDISEGGFRADYRNLTKEFLGWFDVIVLLAGHSSVKMCEGNPIHSLKNNVENFVSLLQKIDDSQCLIYASSSSIYGRMGSSPSKENDMRFTAHNNYDLTKNIIDHYASLSGKNYYGLRFGTVNGYSPVMRDDIMINAMTKTAITEGRIKLFHGETNRPILYIDDLCDAVKSIIELNRPDLSGIYNLCSFNSTSREIATVVSRMTNAPVENFDDLEDKTLNRSVYDFCIDNSKFCNTFDWNPKGTTETIVKGIMENFDKITFVNRSSPYEYQ